MPTIFWGNSTIIARLLWKPWKNYTVMSVEWYMEGEMTRISL
jgi:hypothetical protein